MAARAYARCGMATSTDPQISELRARLSELTIRDEHRLRGRLDRARREDGEALARTAAQIDRALERVERRRAAVDL